MELDAARARSAVSRGAQRVYPTRRDGYFRGSPIGPRNPATDRASRSRYPSTHAVDGGRYPAKRCVGDTVRGRGRHLPRRPRASCARSCATAAPATAAGARRRCAASTPTSTACAGTGSSRSTGVGRWQYTIEAWTDVFGTWRDELERKLAAGQHDLAGEISEGTSCCATAADERRANGDRPDADRARARARSRTDDRRDGEARRGARDRAVRGRRARPAAEGGPASPQPLRLEVDRVRARFGSWYELFPRSWGGLPGVERSCPRSPSSASTSSTCRRSTRSATPTARGATTRSRAGPNDPGSPWAIGDETGGHDAVHPELGTIDDLRSLTARRGGARHRHRARLRDPVLGRPPVAARSIPSGFTTAPTARSSTPRTRPSATRTSTTSTGTRPTGAGCGRRCATIVLHWVDCGVKVFRVDNPHTKPFAFWEWLIEEVHERDRDVVFLAEAFTRRAVMRHLAKVGFSQSYTYFTWKNSRYELTEYVSELAYSGEQEYFRPELLRQHAGHPSRLPAARRAARRSRLGSCSRPRSARATGSTPATSTSRTSPVREGSEEYLDSEKYEIKQRPLDGPLLPLIKRLNEVRRDNPALAAAVQRHLPGHRQRRTDRLRQARRGQYRDHRREPRPPPDPGGAR